MESSPAGPRLFIAIPLDLEMAEALLEWSEAQYPSDPGIRWNIAQQLHITVSFLGEDQGRRPEELAALLEDFCNETTQFDLVLSQVSTQFRGPVPTMIWTQFDHSREFEELATRLATALGHELERKPLPHITLGRIKDLKQPARKLPQRLLLEKDSLTVERLELWLSEPTPTGTSYRTLASFALQPR